MGGMVAVLGAAVLIWAGGALLRLPVALRVALLAGLWAVVVLIHVTLPAGAPLREATGGDLYAWAALGGVAALALAYWLGLSALRRRARPAPRPAAPAAGATFSETELSRYARHIMLREVGGPGQRRLKEARVLVVGAGGLGAPVLMYLAGAGVGTIGVIDDDTVENANLQRQVIHPDKNIGLPKVYSAEMAMVAQNPFVTVRPYHRRLTAEIAADLFADYDLVLDGSDNFATRYLVNETAVALGIPLIAAALTQWEGQISLYDPARGTPCYACVFPQAPDPALVPSCAEAGVLGPLPGVIGAMMAVEAIKAITQAGENLAGRLLIYDALYAQTRTITIKPRADCPVCAGKGAT
jgi:molybdopterin/thiamine biosynthesis adenylyltransferase